MGKRKRYKKMAKTEEGKEEGSNNTVILAGAVILFIVIGVYAVMGRDSSASTSTEPRIFPDFIYTTGKSVEAYTVATQIPDVLGKIPCYCSCVRIGHRSLKDCFLSSNGDYSEHGAYCNTCIYEALDANKWHDQGLSLKEIRSRIDEKYGGGRFAEGTNTPPV
ncbi:MAG: PCYCGC motif-containing (lipo)protein [Candidatus Hydrothermarchaeales archaeon]